MLAATVILGVLHALWHLPAFIYEDTYRSMGLAAGLPVLILSVVAAAITFTWIYNRTHGSILIVALYHALFDWLSVSKAGGAMAPAVMSDVIWVLAVVLVIVYRPAHLSRQEKQVAWAARRAPSANLRYCEPAPERLNSPHADP